MASGWAQLQWEPQESCLPLKRKRRPRKAIERAIAAKMMMGSKYRSMNGNQLTLRILLTETRSQQAQKGDTL